MKWRFTQALITPGLSFYDNNDPDKQRTDHRVRTRQLNFEATLE
jgi:hypothetical protein